MEDEADWIDEDKIELDFVFLDPNPNQFNSIKVFANSFLDGLSYKSSELAEMIINQVQIGTMVGTEEDED